jgi:hypothetical protein
MPKKNTVENVISGLLVDENGCWVHRNPNKKSGYGYVGWENKTRLVHRIVYEGMVGPVPDGLQLDHLCRNRACANPDHLEPVTQSENTRRGAIPNLLKKECPRGHPYSGDNLYTDEKTGRRQCKECRRILKTARRRKNGIAPGRRFGESHHACKLSDDQVSEIRLRSCSETRTSLAHEFGVSVAHVSRVVLGKGRQSHQTVTITAAESPLATPTEGVTPS